MAMRWDQGSSTLKNMTMILPEEDHGWISESVVIPADVLIAGSNGEYLDEFTSINNKQSII